MNCNSRRLTFLPSASRSATWPAISFWLPAATANSRNRVDISYRGLGFAREYGDAFAESLVAGGTTAPEIVVVHAGKIIVHQRVGVDTFKRAREWKRIVDLAATSFGRGQTK